MDAWRAAGSCQLHLHGRHWLPHCSARRGLIIKQVLDGVYVHACHKWVSIVERRTSLIATPLLLAQKLSGIPHRL